MTITEHWKGFADIFRMLCSALCIWTILSHKKKWYLLWWFKCQWQPFCYQAVLFHSTKKAVTTTLTYPWKCTVLHCNHLGNTWKPLVLMTRHFNYCPSASEGDNQSVRSSAPVVSRCFPGGYNVKLYISRGRLAWWLLTSLHSVHIPKILNWTVVDVPFLISMLLIYNMRFVSLIILPPLSPILYCV